MPSWPRIIRRATSSIGSTVVGYGVAQTLVQVLKQCGDDLTRDNVMKQAASLKDFRTEVLLPGIKINTGPTDFAPISQLQLMKFKGAAMGTVRRRHQRRRRRLNSYRPIRKPNVPAPCDAVAGGFFLRPLFSAVSMQLRPTPRPGLDS